MTEGATGVPPPPAPESISGPQQVRHNPQELSTLGPSSREQCPLRERLSRAARGLRQSPPPSEITLFPLCSFALRVFSDGGGD
ncbi:unnamed protein product [Boreogadus saida]